MMARKAKPTAVQAPAKPVPKGRLTLYINRVAPEHSRTSCSDITMYNRAASDGSEQGMNIDCLRCTLLWALNSAQFETKDERETLRLDLIMAAPDVYTIQRRWQSQGKPLGRKPVEYLAGIHTRSSKTKSGSDKETSYAWDTERSNALEYKSVKEADSIADEVKRSSQDNVKIEAIRDDVEEPVLEWDMEPVR